MRRSKPILLPLLLVAALPCTVLAQRVLNPSRPMTSEEAAGVWVGLSEEYSGVFRLVLNEDRSGMLGYTPPRADSSEVDLYRLDRWDQKVDRVRLVLTPVADEAPPIDVTGKVSRRSFTLEIRRRGSARHTVRLVREEGLGAALRRVRDAMAGS